MKSSILLRNFFNDLVLKFLKNNSTFFKHHSKEFQIFVKSNLETREIKF